MTDSRFSDLQDLEDKASDSNLTGFVICYTDQVQRFSNLIKEKSLKPKDVAVVFALLSFYNPRTGLCHVTVKHLAESIEGNYTDVSASISRLKKSLVLTTYVDKVSGQKSIFLNPFIFVSGGRSKRGFLQARFMSLVND